MGSIVELQVNAALWPPSANEDLMAPSLFVFFSLLVVAFSPLLLSYISIYLYIAL